MQMVCNGAKEWLSHLNNKQDAADSERREEVLRRLRLLLPQRDLLYENQNIQNNDNVFSK